MQKTLIRTLRFMSACTFWGFMFSFFLATALAAGNSSAQSVKEVEIAIQLEDVTISQAFEEIESKTRFRFLYNRSVLDGDGQRITLQHELATVEQILADISMQTGTSYHQRGHAIVVGFPNEGFVPSFTEEGRITGQVTDAETGESLPGANLFISQLETGTTTDADGYYSLTNIPSGTYTLRVNYVGYRQAIHAVEIELGAEMELNIELRPDILGLDQIIVTARGASSARREIGTSIATVDTERLQTAPIQNMSQLLQGRVAGARVQLGGGKSGQGSTILLRGTASISLNNEPIIYVDGVRMDNSRSSGIETTTAGVSWSGLDDINPEDIDRIEVVRGASAATLYGSEAAAGVIQIFTKRGTAGSPQFTYRTQVGILNTPRDWWKGSAYSDWFYDEMVQAGNMTTQYLSVRGGTESVRYYASGSFRNETGILPNSGEDYLAFRLNLDFDAREDLRVHLNAGYSDRSVQHVPDANNTRGYTINGLVGGPAGQFGTPTLDHKAIETFQDGNRSTFSIQLDHQPLEFIGHRATFGYESRDEDQHQFFPFGAINNLIEGFKSNYRRHVTNLNVEYIATLRFQPADWLRTTTSGGFQYFNRKVGSSSAIGTGFPMIGLSTVSATVDQSAAESRFEERSAGFFIEQQFGFHDRLFVTVGARADGHSAFGENVDYQIYPKIDASYVLSDHSFWPEQLGTFRLRAAYGTAGQQPGAFDAVRTWLPISAVGAQPAVTPGNLGNPDLKAEVSHEFEAGFDASILNDRLNIDFNYYNQRTLDALYQFRSPPSQGFLATQLRNVGEVRNEGIELSVNGIILNTPGFRWNGLINIGTNQNEVVSLAGGAPIQVQWRQFIREGYSVGAMFGDRFIEKDGETGLASELLQDANGNLPEGWDHIGSAIPTLTAQIGSDFNIARNFTVRILFDHQSGGYLQSSTLRWLWDPRRVVPDDGQGVTTPGPVGTACRNPANDIIRLNCERNSDLSQGDFVFPSDFWKLRELSISYRVPVDFTQRVGIHSATLTFSGRNLWRWQEYDGLESEANYRGDLSNSAIRKQIFFDTPIPRQFIFGLNIDF